MIPTWNRKFTACGRWAWDSPSRFLVCTVVSLADALDELLEVMPEHSQYAQPEVPGGPAVALIGRPNVGKSSLLNKLAGSERAVVNDLAGTTTRPY